MTQTNKQRDHDAGGCCGTYLVSEFVDPPPKPLWTYKQESTATVRGRKVSLVTRLSGWLGLSGKSGDGSDQ